MSTVDRRTLTTLKNEFSIKSSTVLFKEILVKKEFALGLLDQKAFFKEKCFFFL